MTRNLFALCREHKEAPLVIYRVPLDESTLSSVIELFDEQKNAFLGNIDQEIPYNGMYKPDGSQILTIEITQCPEINQLQEAVSNPVRCDDIDTRRFADLGIKALFIGQPAQGNIQISVQNFTKKQILEHKWTLFLNNNAFNRLTDLAFSLDDKLSAVVDNNEIKFKSFHILRAIINIGHLFKEATEEETRNFAMNPIFSCASADDFLKQADEPIRKMISFISRGNILNIDIITIETAAKEIDFDIQIRNDKIIMPHEKKEIKQLLSFLNGDIYKAPITQDRYLTNSKRKI
ncbi:DUF4868 domain-containing protein [Candidatus Tokpelaia sp.]|uniref:DUF4868 domain-containing protein n=1 Tax=Candidatus Tokpelaia sp. TaxID=2233777 RepID=UPI00123BCE92|nr:DUF4868 domain-containing protein [Candidatus Tokpelaia sp.]KAA6405691.1 hypothetical protein DPQ22_03260 [Candidatus Tokpelaia sp.]